MVRFFNLFFNGKKFWVSWPSFINTTSIRPDFNWTLFIPKHNPKKYVNTLLKRFSKTFKGFQRLRNFLRRKNTHGSHMVKNIYIPPVAKITCDPPWAKYFWPSHGQKYLWLSLCQRYLRPTHGQKYLWLSHGQKYLWFSNGQKYLTMTNWADNQNIHEIIN